MFPNRRAGLVHSINRRLLPYLFSSLLFITVGSAADKSKDEETLRNASTILSTMLESNSVPPDVLARANCIVVLPGVKKFGVGVGGVGGRGPMSCRGGKTFTGTWSAPAMYMIGGASVGLQVGGSSDDLVLLVISQDGVDALLQGKTHLGTNVSAAAGPTSASTTGSGNDILTYGRAKGLFAGASLGMATLEPDSDANQRLYDKAITAQSILVQNAVEATPAGQALVSLLNSKVPKRQ